MSNVFKEAFGAVEDTRVERTKKHNFMGIIALEILNVMAETHEECLKHYVVLENGNPLTM